jgi:hypothetical protein
MYGLDLSRPEAWKALVETVRRLDPAYFNPDAMVLMGNFAAEAIRTPELLQLWPAIATRRRTRRQAPYAQ